MTPPAAARQQQHAISHMEHVAEAIGKRYFYTSGMAVNGMEAVEKPKNVGHKTKALTPLPKEDRERLRTALEGRYASHVAVEMGIDEGCVKSALRGFKISDRTKRKVLAWLGERA